MKSDQGFLGCDIQLWLVITAPSLELFQSDDTALYFLYDVT